MSTANFTVKRVLQPIVHRDWYTRQVEQEVAAYFREVIYGPLLALVEEAGFTPDTADQGPPSQIRHAKPFSSVVTDALRSGRLWYTDGVFYSDAFSAAISRELRALGARWDAGEHVFRLEAAKLPVALREAAAGAALRSQALHQQVIDLLTTMEGTVAVARTGISFGGVVDRVAADLDHQFNTTVGAMEQVTVQPKLTPEMKRALAEDFTENIELPIKDFTREQVLELRELAQKNALEGGRADRLAKLIEARFGVAKRKAVFLASNETSLMVSKYREQRYRAIGVRRYKWSTSHDERVRPDHARLNGGVFSFDDPPICDRRTGRTGNPGEDYNCLPADSPINFVNGIKKAFRRWYDGELTTIVTDSGETLRATPNHPVLTLRGWKPIGLLDKTDEIVQLRKELFLSPEPECQKSAPTISKIFESLRESGLGFSFPGQREQFHGDGTYADVDVVTPARNLYFNWQTGLFNGFTKFVFTKTFSLASALRRLRKHFVTFFFRYGLSRWMRSGGQTLSFVGAESRHSDHVGFGYGAYSYASFDEPPANNDSFISGPLGDRQFTFPSDVSIDYGLRIKLESICRLTRLRSVSTGIFRGHVYNMETCDGCYATENVIVSNCRCVAMPVIEAGGRAIIP